MGKTNITKSSIMDTTFGAVLEIIVVAVILLFLFFATTFNKNGSSEPFYDDSKELEAQDEQMKQQAEDYERQQRAKEAQEEYEDYLEWVNNGGY